MIVQHVVDLSIAASIAGENNPRLVQTVADWLLILHGHKSPDFTPIDDLTFGQQVNAIIFLVDEAGRPELAERLKQMAALVVTPEIYAGYVLDDLD